MMPIILPDNRLRLQLPQPRIVIRARGHQVRRIRAERAIPHPALVRRQIRRQREGDGLVGAGLRLCFHAPDARAVVRGAGC